MLLSSPLICLRRSVHVWGSLYVVFPSLSPQLLHEAQLVPVTLIELLRVGSRPLRGEFSPDVPQEVVMGWDHNLELLRQSKEVILQCRWIHGELVVRRVVVHDDLVQDVHCFHERVPPLCYPRAVSESDGGTKVRDDIFQQLPHF